MSLLRLLVRSKWTKQVQWYKDTDIYIIADKIYKGIWAYRSLRQCVLRWLDAFSQEKQESRVFFSYCCLVRPTETYKRSHLYFVFIRVTLSVLHPLLCPIISIIYSTFFFIWPSSALCSDVPDPPENVKCTGVGEDTASIQWEPPKFDGGVPVKGKTSLTFLLFKHDMLFVFYIVFLISFH